MPDHATDNHRNLPAINNAYYLLLIGIGIAAAVIFIYGQGTNFGFVDFDDNSYIIDNPIVQKGFSVNNVRWALLTNTFCNWHPVTWLSYMADAQFLGAQPGPMHIVNLFIHLLNALLLLLILYRATRSVWPSGLVAILFAVHPLHVESVAWISERKDVLFTFFGLLSLHAYFSYTARKTRLSYVFALIFYLFSLLSKAMLVTMPFLLLLLDCWPLHRLTVKRRFFLKPGIVFHGQMKGLEIIYEKIPFLFLAIISGMLTYMAQKDCGAMIGVTTFNLSARFANALHAYWVYIKKTVWPSGLSCFYPPYAPFAYELILSAAVITVLLIVGYYCLSRYPFISVGLFWFLGTMVPTVGIIKVGSQALADRYAYFPNIGLYIAMAFATFTLLKRPPLKKTAICLWISAIFLLMGVAHRQAGYWSNSQTLFNRAVAINGNNFFALYGLARVFESQGNFEKAISLYNRAIENAPDFTNAHFHLARLYQNRGNFEKALLHYRAALILKPDFYQVLNNMGMVFLLTGNLTNASTCFKNAALIQPNYRVASTNYQKVYPLLEQLNTAETKLKEAISLLKRGDNIRLNLKNLIEQMTPAYQVIIELNRKLVKQPGFKQLRPQDIEGLKPFYRELTRMLDLLMQLSQNDATEIKAMSSYLIACIYAHQNNIGEARKWLRMSQQMGCNRKDLISAHPEIGHF